ncbi:putative Cytochrome P450 2H2 [Hypsibius exemplaris]|uniref:Cytochrome P450 2H2 n=1 Tax=Hypsibius exemplaris TaxID=2072580 RepID=A0A1W0WQF5_HYPEX|nr:putative Cytochrome P450 2H2 [Hypsibius exemplaris]
MLLTLILTAAPVVLLGLLHLWRKLSRPPNYPPGPPALPFFGNLLSLGGRPERKILEWKEKYGDVLGMFNGRTRVVVLSDFHTLRKVFSEDNASGRHTHSVLRTEANGLPMGSGLLTSQETLWKSQRRFALSTLRDLGMGKNWLEDTIIAEVESLCQVLRDTKEAPFNPKVHLTNSVSNVICALIFGKRFELTDPKFSRLTGLITENVATIKLDFVASTLPFLLWFPNNGFLMVS